MVPAVNGRAGERATLGSWVSVESSDGQLHDIGERVRTARKARGWSQERLAKEAGVSPNTVLSIEKGKRQAQSGKLRPVLDALGLAPLTDEDKLDLTGVQHDARTYLQTLVRYFAIEDPAVVSAFVDAAWKQLTDEFIEKMRKDDAAGV